MSTNGGQQNDLKEKIDNKCLVSQIFFEDIT